MKEKKKAAVKRLEVAACVCVHAHKNAFNFASIRVLHIGHLLSPTAHEAQQQT